MKIGNEEPLRTDIDAIEQVPEIEYKLDEWQYEVTLSTRRHTCHMPDTIRHASMYYKGDEKNLHRTSEKRLAEDNEATVTNSLAALLVPCF